MRWIVPALVGLVLAACGREPAATPEGRFVGVGDGAVEVRFPPDWRENKEEHPFELQWFSGDESMTTGVFEWARSDLAEGVDGEKLLHLQIEDMRGKRTNFKVVAARETEELEGKRLSTLVYSGEKALSKFHYRFTLVELREHPDVILVVLQTSIPSHWGKDEPVLKAITASIRARTQGVPKS